MLRNLLFFIFVLALFSCSEDTKPIERPNIVFIMTDDHARSAVSCYGSSLNQTPNIDRLAKNGLKFDNAFVTNSICGPSRAVLLTGKFSHKNGFKTHHDIFNGQQATLPKYLQDAGYYTAIIGKWHLKSNPTGFDYHSILLGQGKYYNPRFTNGQDTILQKGYATNLITDQALVLLDKKKDQNQPFFLMIQHKAPHRNWMPDSIDLVNSSEKVYALPESFYDDYTGKSKAAKSQDMRVENMYLGFDHKLFLPNGREDEIGTGGVDTIFPKAYDWWLANYNRLTDQQKATWDQYYGPIIENYNDNPPTGDDLLKWRYQRYMNDYLKCISSVDRNVGRVLDYLDENDLTDNTIVIYTSDQGFFLGEHGWYDKRFMYEPSLTIPLLMQHPDLKGNAAYKEMVQNIDFAPTILDFAGVPVPQDMQGVSLKPYIYSEANETIEPLRSNIYYHYYQNGRWHFAEKHLGVRTDRYKLIYFYDLQEWELYDLYEDPHEIENLYHNKAYSQLSDSLKVVLRELITTYDDTTAPIF